MPNATPQTASVRPSATQRAAVTGATVDREAVATLDLALGESEWTAECTFSLADGDSVNSIHVLSVRCWVGDALTVEQTAEVVQTQRRAVDELVLDAWAERCRQGWL